MTDTEATNLLRDDLGMEPLASPALLANREAEMAAREAAFMRGFADQVERRAAELIGGAW